jgi:hypothetical protein
MASTTTGAQLVPTERGGGWRFTPPAPRTITIKNPAAGIGWSYTMPADLLLRLSIVRCKLVTAATAGTRVPVLKVAAQTGAALVTTPVGTAVAATKTVQLVWQRNGPTADYATSLNVQAIPNIVLPPKCKVSVTVTGVKATDQLSTVVLLAELI